MSVALQSFVEEQAAKLTPDDIVGLAARMPALRERFSHNNMLEHPQLADQYDFLALLVTDFGQHLDCGLSDNCERETAFALLYLEKRGDLLPDDMPELGMMDNQAVVSIVLHKHRDALRECPRGFLFQWDADPVDFDQILLDRLHHRLERMRLNGLRD